MRDTATGEASTLTNVTKLNALRRLTMKVHGESPAPRKHKEWTIRLYDGDRVVGYVGLVDLMRAEREFAEAIKSATARSDEQKEAEEREARIQAYHDENKFELKVYAQSFVAPLTLSRGWLAIRSLTRRCEIVIGYARRGRPDVVISSSNVRIRLEELRDGPVA